MQPIESVKFLGAFSIILAWVGLAVLITKWPRDISLTFSRHAARNKKAYWMMALMQTIVLPAFFIFAEFWLVPTFHFGPVIATLMGLSVLGLFVAGWVPDTSGWRNKIHEYCAYGAYFILIPVVISFVVSSHVSTTARIVSLLASMYMIIAITALFTYPKAKNRTLPIQAGCLASFHIAILALTYIR